MKLLIVLLNLGLLLTVSAQADEVLKDECLVATNPQVITIKVNELNLSEKAKSAKLKLTTIDSRRVAKLKIKTKSLNYDTYAINWTDQSGLNGAEFGVECDGGHLALKAKGNSLLANTSYLAGEVKLNNQEGCHSGTAVFKNLVFKTVACK